MIFSCTQKVLEKTKKHYPTAKEKAELGTYNWYVNLVPFGRKKGLLFVHSETLFMSYIEDATVNTIKSLQFLFVNQLREDLLNSELPPELVDRYLSQSPSVQISKTNSRKVLAVMSQISFFFQSYIVDANSRAEFINRMNEVPYNYEKQGKKDFGYPIKAMEELLVNLK